MRLLVPALIIFFAPSLALSVIDPEPNTIGVYFDLDATTQMIDVTEGALFWAYVILTNPTEPIIQYCEYRHDVVIPEFFESTVFMMHISDFCGYGCINGPVCGDICMGNPPDGFHRDNYASYATWFHGPLVAQPATELLAMRFYMYKITAMEFYIGPVHKHPSTPWEVPAYRGENPWLLPLHISSGSAADPVAKVNSGLEPTAVNLNTWGHVKSLYR